MVNSNVAFDVESGGFSTGVGPDVAKGQKKINDILVLFVIN